MLTGKSLFRVILTAQPIWTSASVVHLRSTAVFYTSKLDVQHRVNSLDYLFVKDRVPYHRSSSNGTLTRQFGSMSDTEDKKAELKKRLTPLQYHVTQEKGTERAFTGKFNKCSESGQYSCVVCNQPLFSSKTKFDSGCGWPAFNDVLDQGRVKLTKDTSHGMIRTEVTCAQCGAHLGHVFGDGPPPTKKRFCINSAAMQFHPAAENEDSK